MPTYLCSGLSKVWPGYETLVLMTQPSAGNFWRITIRLITL